MQLKKKYPDCGGGVTCLLVLEKVSHRYLKTLERALAPIQFKVA